MLHTLERILGSCLLFLGCFLFLNPTAKATHAMGADLTYECIGQNQYLVTLKFYRDCNGIPAPTAATVSFSCGTNTFSSTLTQSSMQEITPTCPGIIGTACNGGTGTFGIEEYIYQSTVSIPVSTCTNWTMSWSHCCRNNAITTLTTPGSNLMYISATINTANNLCNNSPAFLNTPTPFYCANQPVFYNHGAFDSDGDSLLYSLTNCYDMENVPVSYDAVNGISATNPMYTLSGVTIDAATGALSFTPSQPQVGVVCVLVEEFRNGQKVGEIVRDIQFTVVNCTNTMPSLSGINGSTNYSTTATVGQQLCFTLYSNDPDSGQTTNLSYNGGIPAGIFTSSGAPFANGTFCWTPTAADVGTHNFTVTVADNYCPIVGQNTYTYTIVVNPGTNNCTGLAVGVSNVNDVQCSGNDGTATITATGGTPVYTYSVINWTTGEVFTNTSGIFSNLTPGTYNVLVTDANGCQPDCSNASFTIAGNGNPIVANVIAQDPYCPSNSTYAGGGNNNPGGSITITASGGTAPYLYSIGNGFATANTFNNLAAGTYQVVVIDANGCSYTETVTITEPDPIVLNIGNVTQPTCGQCNGSFNVAASGGSGGFAYYLNGQIVSPSAFSNLCPGTYTVAVCDIRFCIVDTTITLIGTPGFTLSAAATDVACNGDCDGTAVVTAAGNSSTITYNWSNGVTGANNTGLCAGIYTVTASDANGCDQTATVTVGEPAALNVTLVSSSDETCAANDGSAILGASGGTTPYAYTLANTTAGNSTTNSIGSFGGLSAGIYAYQVVDANGCIQECLGHFTLDNDCRTTSSPTLTPALSNLTASGPSLVVNPNPANSFAQVLYAAQDEERLMLTIMDSNGKELQNRKGLMNQGSVELNISSWTGGTYFVVLRNNKGQVLKTTRLVISR